MNGDAKIIADMLVYLIGKSKGIWSHPNLTQLYQELLSIKSPMTPEIVNELSRKIKSSRKVDFNKTNAFLYLPPFAKMELAPIMSLKCDLNKSSEDIHIEIEMYKYVEEKKDGSSEKNLKGYGFRFEGPHHFEEEDSNVRHNYYHVQFMKRTAITPGELKGCPFWISDTVPCIPAGELRPVSLILFMLISLYGKEIVKEISTSVDGIPEYLAQFKYIIN